MPPRLLPAALFLAFLAQPAQGQCPITAPQPGDYRSYQDGLWQQGENWQAWDGQGWVSVASTAWPGSVSAQPSKVSVCTAIDVAGFIEAPRMDGSLEVGQNASIGRSSAAASLYVKGGIRNEGSIGVGDLYLDGSGARLIEGDGSWAPLNINTLAGSILVLGSNVTFDAGLSIGADASMDLSGLTLTMRNTGTLVRGIAVFGSAVASGRVRIVGTIVVSPGNSFGPDLVVDNGQAELNTGPYFGDVVVSEGGTLMIRPNSTVTLHGAMLELNGHLLGGNYAELIFSGTSFVNRSPGVVALPDLTFRGGVDQTLIGDGEYDTLFWVNHEAPEVNLQLAGNMRIHNKLIVAMGDVALNSYTIDLGDDGRMEEQGDARVKGRGLIRAVRSQNALGRIDVGMGFSLRSVDLGGPVELHRRHEVQFDGGIERFFDIFVDPAYNVDLNARIDEFKHHPAELNGIGPGDLALYRLAPGDAAWEEMGGITYERGIQLTGVDHFSRWTAGLKGLVPRARTTAADHPNSGTGSDPVNTFTGEFVYRVPPDFTLGGPMGLLFERHYASGLDRAGVACDLGMNWRHTFCWNLVRTEFAASVTTASGRTLTFERSGGSWDLSDAIRDADFQLVDDGDQTLFVDPIMDRFYRFDGTGRLVEVEDRSGNRLMVLYADGTLARVEDDYGRILQFSHDPQNRLTSISDGTRIVTLGYSDGLLAESTDPIGRVTAYAYDGMRPEEGLLVSVTRPAGNVPISNVYDEDGRVVEQSDATGNPWTFAYDGAETVMTAPDATQTSWVHDGDGNLTGWSPPGGMEIQLQYDERGRRVAIVDRLGGMTSYSYDDASEVVAVTQADGAVSGHGFQQASVGGARFMDHTETVFPSGEAIQVQRDPVSGLATMITDQEGFSVQIQRDAAGLEVSATNPAGGTWTYGYDGAARLTSVADPDGASTAISYDDLGRVSRMGLVNGEERTWEYDDADQLTRSVDESGSYTRFTYDPNGNLTGAEDARGSVQYRYDAADRLSRVVTRGGASMDFDYDQNGRLSGITDPAGSHWSASYGGGGRMNSLTAPDGSLWRRTYDAEGVPVSATDPSGLSITFQSGSLGEMTGLTDPGGESWSVSRTPDGAVLSWTGPDGLTSQVDRSARGLASAWTLPGGLGVLLSRNGLGQVTSSRTGTGGSWTSDFDERGRMVSRTDPLGRSVDYDYNPLGLVSRRQFPGGLGATDYGYDARGRLLSIAYPNGGQLDFAYDAAGRLVTGEGLIFSYDADDHLVGDGDLALGYDASGRVASLTLAPGKTVTYTRDPVGRVTAISDWIGDAAELTYDASGRITTLVRANGVSTRIGYDETGHRASTEEVNASEVTVASTSLERDRTGRVRARVDNGYLAPELAAGTIAMTYDAADQVAGHQYDDLGRTVSDGDRTYTWDPASRMASKVDGAASAEFQYDGMGLLTGRVEAGKTTEYVWSHAFALPSPVVTREDGADRAYHVFLPDGRLVYSVDADTDTRTYYHFDEVGNTRLVTSGDGAVTSRFAYDPYGRVVATEGDPDVPFTLAGQFGVIRDIASPDLYYLRRRWYDSRLARFVTRDPVISLHPLRTDPYQYAARDPVRFVDPTGADPEPVPQGAVDGGSRFGWSDVLTWASNELGALGTLLDETGSPGLGKTLGTAGSLISGYSTFRDVGPSEEAATLAAGTTAADFALGKNPVGFLVGLGSDAVDFGLTCAGYSPLQGKELFYNGGRFATGALDDTNVLGFLLDFKDGKPLKTLVALGGLAERQARKGGVPRWLWWAGEEATDIPVLNAPYWLFDKIFEAANAWDTYQTACDRTELLKGRTWDSEREAPTTKEPALRRVDR